eukprot:scaffold111721_cov47-Prasinocladus_malaysianus.AAC.2
MTVVFCSVTVPLSLQDLLPETGKPEMLLEVTGQDLMGVPLSAPNAIHERVYVLPLLTILMNKGTGIVTSVPSDSPDDYTALMVSNYPLVSRLRVCAFWNVQYFPASCKRLAVYVTISTVRKHGMHVLFYKECARVAYMVF